MFIEVLIGMVVLVLNTALGLAILYKNKKSWTNRLFFIITLIISAYTIINYNSLHPPGGIGPNGINQLLWIRLVMFTDAFLGPALVIFVHTFPKKNITLAPKYIYSLISLAIGTAIISLTPGIFASITYVNGNPIPNPGPAIPLYMLDFAGMFILSFIILLKRYRLSQGIERTQFRLLFAGITTTFSLMAITGFLFVVILKITSLVVLGPFYSFLLIASISYAIIKHKFLDIGFLVFRAVSFAILTTIIIIVYAVGLFTVLRFIPYNQSFYASIILALILVYTFNPLRTFIEKLTANIFYKTPYVSEELLEKLGEIIRSTLVLDTLGKNTMHELTSTMHITKAALVVTQKDSLAQIIPFNHHQTPNYSENTLHNLEKAAKNHLLIFEDLEESPVKMLLRDLDIAMVMPLKVQSTLHGFLLLSEKASGEIYSQQDIDVLEIVMPQLSLAIQNAKSYDEIKHFADTLKDEVDKATSNLKKANKDLRHLDKLKDEFVFIATHELKNPVTAMRGYLSMLLEGSFGQVPDKFKEPLEQMNYSNQQLVDLVNDLLQIARAEAKTLTINTTAVNLCDIATSVVKSLKPLADQKHLIIDHACPAKGLMVQSDENRLKEIMNNLISNAIKYSDQGTIAITYESTGQTITTHVKDQGVGIAQKDTDKIFTRFFRVDEEAAKGIPGTGLGLFIVKQLIEKMGGKIWFTSKYGQGTTFSFSLPKAHE